VARLRPLRALAIGVAIAAVLPLAAAARVSEPAAAQPQAQEAESRLASDESGTFAVVNDAPPTISISGAAVDEGDAGATNASFAVSLSHDPTETVTVDYESADGLAGAGEDPPDYDETSGTLTFLPGGALTQTIAVPVRGDSQPELHEDFFVQLSNAQNAVVDVGGSARGLIRNDDGDCTYDPVTKTVHLPVDAAERVLFVLDGWINADNASCGAAAVTNTETISSTGGNGDDSLVVDLSGGEPFAPGVGDELTGPEIEIVVDLQGGSNSLTVSGSTGADEIVLGAGGINLNPGEEAAAADADVTFTGNVDRLAVTGNHGDDTIFAAGGLGTGGQSGLDLSLSGNEGDDDVTGGSGGDLIFGGDGDDAVDGGEGNDTADFSGATGPVAVDLRAGTAQGFGADMLSGVENVTGGSFDDVLAGDSEANVLEGGSGQDTADFTSSPQGVAAELNHGTAIGDGDDTLSGIENITGSAHADLIDGNALANRLEGGAGDDSVDAGAGDDELHMRDGEADTSIVCGDGDADLAVTDAPGVDEPGHDCETVDAQLPELSIDGVSVGEGDTGNSTAGFEVSLSEAATDAVTVSYAVTGVTAAPDADFLEETDDITIPAGELSATVEIDVVGDRLDEGVETFRVDLSHPTNATGEPSATGSIVDDDDTPVVTSQAVTTNEDTAKTITLGPPTDSDGDALVYEVEEPEHGTLSGLTGNQVTYTPHANYGGADDFATRAGDGVNTSGDATVAITVDPVNDAPVAAAQSVTTAEDTYASITLAATDVEGSALTYSVAPPSHGVLSGTAPNLTYTPTANYSGSDSFTFEANDGALDSNVATVSITVTAVNDGVTAHDQAVQIAEDTPVGVALSATGGDAALTYSVQDEPSHGTLSGTPPSVTYEPDLNYHGADSFTFRADDGNGASNLATVSVTVDPVNDAPVAASDVGQVAEDSGFTSFEVLLNDEDVDGDELEVVAVSDPPHGTAEIGSVRYRPDANYHGADTVTYTISDGTLIATATLTMTVTSVNDPPVAQNQPNVTTPYGAPVAITLSSTDLDGGPPAYSVVSPPLYGTLSGTAPNLTYTPAAGYSGPDSFTFKANDGHVDSILATVSITIQAAPPRPPPPPPPAKPRYGLSVAKSGTGAGTVRGLPGISCGADCTEEYESGTTVTLTAAAAPASRFGSWTGACSGTSATCMIAMDAAKAVTATFTRLTVKRKPKFKPVKVCHRGRTITVRTKAGLKKHLKHRDKRGVCKPKRKRQK
jgi:Bacterial Ig domain/Divergent InlB B-repeat domain/Calx-beta domain/RTX calcium-binding nonapeptide repeat (4 copies)